jgi:hypothetical protein
LVGAHKRVQYDRRHWPLMLEHDQIKHHRAPETAGGSVLVASTGHDSGFAT